MLTEQENNLIEIVNQNPIIKEMLDRLDEFITHPWYISSGAVNQTVWNHITGRKLTHGIDDYDIIYWNENYTKEEELTLKKTILKSLGHPDLKHLDVVNQVGVHTWFHKEFGKRIEPYLNLEHAIGTWPATVTCIGITKRKGDYHIYAPYGLDDIFDMTIRTNAKALTPKAVYIKAKKWKQNWPELKVIS